MADESRDLGLVTAVLEMSSGVSETEGRQTQTITVRIETADGARYSISLTIEAAKAMISGIATWPPITNFLLERERAKLQ
jgi:hypothetical protein